MTKLTKNEKILRKANEKWKKFLAEGAFKKTLKEFDEDDAYHFDQDKSDSEPLPPEAKSAQYWVKKGDKVRIYGLASKKGPQPPEEYKCKYGIVKDFSKENDREVMVQFDDGKVLSLDHSVMSKNPGTWKMDYFYPDCEDSLGEGMGGESGTDWDDLLSQIMNHSPDANAAKMAERAADLVDAGNIDAATDLIAEIMNSTSDADTSETAEKAYDAVEALQIKEGGTMGEYGKMDAEQGLPPTKIGRGNEEYMAAYNAVMQKMGKEPVSMEKPDQAYLDALRSGQLEETVRKIVAKKLEEASGARTAEAVNQIERILNDLYDDGVDNATLVTLLKQIIVDIGRGYVGQPSESKIQENEKKKFKVGEFVHIVGGSLKGATGKVIELVTTTEGEQGYVIELYSDAKMRVFGQRGDEVIATAEDMESGGTTDGMELYDIDEKLSAADKEFHKSVMDKGKVPNLKGDMGPIPGLEGPFQFRSGAVLYYDPKAGKYYDRGKDMYLDNDEASRLIMEKDEKEFAKIFARAKDMLVLSARSRVPVSLKSVQSALDVIKMPSEMEKGKLIVKNEYVIADKDSLPETAKQISFTKYAMDYLSNLPGEQLDLPME